MSEWGADVKHWMSERVERWKLCQNQTGVNKREAGGVQILSI